MEIWRYKCGCCHHANCIFNFEPEGGGLRSVYILSRKERHLGRNWGQSNLQELASILREKNFKYP